MSEEKAEKARSKRIQTLISDEHYSMLQGFTEQYGKMNNVIEKGLELIRELGDPSTHKCDATSTLSIQQQMLDQGFAFVQQRLVSGFLLNLVQGNLSNWTEMVLDNPQDAANPLYAKLTLDNSFGSLKYFLDQESDYSRYYIVVFSDEKQNTITIEPHLFPEFPEFVALIICRSLLFLGFNFRIVNAETNIGIQWLPEHTNPAEEYNNLKTQLQAKFKSLRERFDPVGAWLLSKGETADQSFVERIKTLQNITNFVINQGIDEWEPGKFQSNVLGRMVLLPEEFLMKWLKNKEDAEQLSQKIFLPFFPELEELPLVDAEQRIKFLFENVWGLGKVAFSVRSIESAGLCFDCSLLPALLSPFLKRYDLVVIKESCVKTGQSFCRYTLKSRTITILLVDDEEEIIEALNREFRRFKSLKSNILTAKSGANALEVIRTAERLPDIIIADYKMEDMTGVELFEKVKTLFPGIRRVLITAYGGEPELIEKAINRAGIDFFLNKPWKPETLAKAAGIEL